MAALELFFRFAGISQLLVLVVVLIKDHHDKTSGLLIAAWALSGACYLAVVPAFTDWQSDGWSYAFLVGALAWPVLFWLVAKSLFLDRFKLRWYDLVALIFVVVASLFGGAGAIRGGFSAILPSSNELIIPGLTALIFELLALFVVMRDWRDDLVESRRRLRFLLLVVSGFYAIVVGVAILILNGMPGFVDAQVLDTINAGIVFLLCFATSIAIFSVHSEFIAPSATSLPLAKSPPEDFTPIIVGVKRLMHEEHVYCEHGLTIGSLAETLSQKEYKLRRVINGEFGYRNFNDFLNQHRITEAARRLLAPDTKNLPVLTIAIDVGYSSLGPFSRAFKELLRMTPTEYRASAALGASAANVSDLCVEQDGDENSP